MSLLTQLGDLSTVRRVLWQASSQYSDWKRWLFGDELVRLTHRAKNEFGDHFKDLFSCGSRDPLLLALLELNCELFEECIFSELDLNKPGHLVSSLAFFAWLAERVIFQTTVSPETVFDCASVVLWRAIRRCRWQLQQQQDTPTGMFPCRRPRRSSPPSQPPPPPPSPECAP
nr:small T-antigen [Lemur mastadenovirus]